jgi:hypothetical protein
MIDYRAVWPGFNFQQFEIFLFCTASRLALGPTQPPIISVPGDLSPRVKQQQQQQREADHSPPSNSEVKHGGAIPPVSHESSWHDA